MTEVYHYDPGNSTRYTVTASPLPSEGFRGAPANSWIVTGWSAHPRSYVLADDGYLLMSYFEEKFDPQREMSTVDRECFLDAVVTLLDMCSTLRAISTVP